MKLLKFPMRYLPKVLTKKDKKTQIKMLIKSKKLYKKNKYYTRKQLPSYKNKVSNHILNARKIYNIKSITPNKELAIKTGCNLSTLNQIVKKGEGAYYSSGSRPNQTPKSWGLARLASSITSGKAAAGVLIRPVTVAEIQRTADEGLLMPPKSTFFTPKLRTGPAIRPLH